MSDKLITAGWALSQPWRGIFGLAVCLMIAIGITSAFPSMDAFLGLMMVWAVACVAPEVVMGLVWEGQWPAEKQENPWKGFALTFLMFALGSLALWWATHFIGHDAITPILQHYLIFTVVVALWLVVAFRCWPFAGRWSLGATGFVVMILTHLITLLLFYLLWDFGGAPFPGIQPVGPFAADSAVVFGVVTAFWLFVFVIFDMWPLSKFPSLMKQPVMGIALFIVVLVLSIISWAVMHWSMDMPQYELLIKLPICGLFGIFIILPMLQTWPGRQWGQPVKGCVNLVLAGVLGLIAFFAVKALGAYFTGVDFGVAEAYPVNYLWMATFMLGLVFPAMFMYGPFFDFWPLAPTPPPPGQEGQE